MKRYFFNIRHDGNFVVDLEGETFSSNEAAQFNAVGAVREMVAASIRRGLAITDDLIEVRDDADLLISTVHYRDAILALFVP